MNIAEQMQAQIAFNKALPQIQMQLSTKDTASIPYQDGLIPLLIEAGFDVRTSQYDSGTIFVSFKNKGGFWADR